MPTAHLSHDLHNRHGNYTYSQKYNPPKAEAMYNQWGLKIKSETGVVRNMDVQTYGRYIALNYVQQGFPLKN
jgi:hypothetical protein